jgi:hypothetical protein
MTKFDKVLQFVNSVQEFTWNEFTKEFECSYPCAETNYLSMLVKVGYIEKYTTGKYRVMFTSSGITYKLLLEQSKGNYNWPEKEKDHYA